MRFRRPNGKTAKLTLGQVARLIKEDKQPKKRREEPDRDPVVRDALTLAAARRLAGEINHRRARGEDVVAVVEHRDRLQRAARGAETFDQAAKDFVEQHSKRMTRRWQERARLLGVRPAEDGESLELIPKGLADRWSGRAIADITGDDIFEVIDECREKGVPGLERRADGPSEPRAMVMFATLSKMFSWLVERRRVAANPCAGIKRPKKQDARDRVLTDAEVAAFWKAASAERKEFAAVLKLLLLTGQRLGEVRGMRHAELSKDGDHPGRAHKEPPRPRRADGADGTRHRRERCGQGRICV